uniref:Uncharacterized protein n=1 Tax=Cucumis melo TaxID=3656 RepID=A0A9I9DTW2_CUCME
MPVMALTLTLVIHDHLEEPAAVKSTVLLPQRRAPAAAARQTKIKVGIFPFSVFFFLIFFPVSFYVIDDPITHLKRDNT